MQKIILAILLTGANASWAVVWVEVGKTENLTAYIDPSSVRNEGDRGTAWDMFDYQTAQTGVGGKRYWSAKRQLEYDCKEGKVRVLAISSHIEHLAKGEVLAAASVRDNWKTAAAGSIDASLWRYVCTKGR